MGLDKGVKHDFAFSIVTKDLCGTEQMEVTLEHSRSVFGNIARIQIDDIAGNVVGKVCPLDSDALDLLIASLQIIRNRMQP